MAEHGFNLNDFMAKNRDFSRGYTFYIKVGGGYINTNEAKYLVKSASLPTSTIPVAEVNWQGNKYKLGTTQEFSEFTVTYNVDPLDNIRRNYLTWEQYIHNPDTNLHGEPDGYMADIQLEHLSHTTGSVILTYTLIKAWPSSIGALTLDYGTKEVATFDVTFAYQFHTTV